jgi:BMFP domain-containing protein YqiC
MLDKEKLEKISDKIREFLKNSPIEDISQGIDALIKSKCTELGLVSREEFDVQTEVLRRTREKLEAVEKELEKYETKKK